VDPKCDSGNRKFGVAKDNGFPTSVASEIANGKANGFGFADRRCAFFDFALRI